MKHFLIFLLSSLLVGYVLTGCKKDNPTVLPTVISTEPIDKAINIALNSKISATFSVEMDSTTVRLMNFIVMRESEIVLGTIEYKNKSAIFSPTDVLLANSVYTVKVTTGILNIAGNGIKEDYEWSFTTGTTIDNTIPVVNLASPAHNETGVGRNNSVEIVFSEAMDPSTITSSSFFVKQGTTMVAGDISYAENTATFTPTNTLEAGKVYTATITTNITDIAGNAIAENIIWTFTTGGSDLGFNAVNLKTSTDYVILAKSAITNSSISAITGDLGLSPAATSYITGLSITNATGFATSAQVSGKIYAADMPDPTAINLTTAVEDMITAYNDAAGRTLPDFIELGTGNIGGKTLEAGLYKWTNSVTVPTNVTISGGENDIWIFQIAGNLTSSSAVNIILEGGAQAKNIFWQVSGAVTLGSTSHFEGIILSKTSIELKAGASLNGKALAQTAVILDSNVVTNLSE